MDFDKLVTIYTLRCDCFGCDNSTGMNFSFKAKLEGFLYDFSMFLIFGFVIKYLTKMVKNI